ncbi:expressed unknown protein [Seminavis robusta]|uniref:Uncharacterized protein n=1 Tax=Seminavis robusta TaxID=568900 RepID=A0A9N8E1A5_9STRA|nr:expressed unknown protein [Seminavis robusta]|eukprot:Sro459_g147270.1 n/a (177) ;mRNA; f:24074-24604
MVPSDVPTPCQPTTVTIDDGPNVAFLDNTGTPITSENGWYTQGGLHSDNSEQVSMGIVDSGGSLYMVVVYNQRFGRGGRGEADIEVTGTTGLVLVDDSGEVRYSSGTISGDFKWGGAHPDGFVASVDSGSTVCITHKKPITTGLTSFRFIQGDNSETIYASSLSEITCTEFCVEIP